MAKNKTFKRQAEATRLLEKIGATRRISIHALLAESDSPKVLHV